MKRNAKLKIECRSVKFSPNGTCWACVSSEGLHVFSADVNQYFTPYELDENISIQNLVDCFKRKDYYNAFLVMFKSIYNPNILNKDILATQPTRFDLISLL